MAAHGRTVESAGSSTAVAESYSTSDASLYTVQYFDVLSLDGLAGQATLWSIGTTNIGNGWTGHGKNQRPIELLRPDTAYGVDDGTYRSALGAYIFLTSTGQVGYDMSGMSAATRLQIDDLAVGQALTDSFYYAVRLHSGGFSWNEATVTINGAEAQIEAAPGQVVENQHVDAGGNLADSEALSVKAASGDATSFAIAPASSATIGTVTLNGATLNPDGSYIFASGSGRFTYTVSNDAVLAIHLGYGEAQKEWFDVTTANGTTASFYETIDGNITAPVVSAAATENSIAQDSSVRLNISAVDNDDNASLTYSISGLPDGATLSSAADPAGVTYVAATQSWTVAAGALTDLILTPGAAFTGEFQFAVVVTDTEVNPNNSTDVATAATAATIAITVVPAPAAPPSDALLDVPGAYATFVTGINGTDQVVGYYDDSSGQHGFLYDGTQYIALNPVPGADAAEATAINDAGEIVGFYGDGTGFHGFLYASGAYQRLDASGTAYYTVAAAINATGEIAGYYYDSAGEHGFLFDSSTGSYTTLDGPTGAQETYVSAINGSGEVAGYYYNGVGDAFGFIYDNGSYQSLAPQGSYYTQITGLNDAGEVVGNYLSANGSYGFLYDSGTGGYTTLYGPNGATTTQVSAINSTGVIAGYYYDSSGSSHSFVYHNGSYTPVEGSSNAQYVNATAINDSGNVAGDAVDARSEESFSYSSNDGTYTAFAPPSGTQSAYATTINDTGKIGGDYNDSAGQHGFIYNLGSGVYTALDAEAGAYDTNVVAINNSGEVLGYYDDNSGQHGFVYDGSTYTTLAPAPGATGGYAYAINNGGEVAGYYQDSAGTHGFLFDSGSGAYTTLDGPPTDSSTFATYATAVNDLGTIVGYYDDSSGEHGFIYQNGTYTSFDASATAQWTDPVAVNKGGAVLGYYADNSGEHIFIYQAGNVTNLDELPATAILTATGFNDVGQVVGSYTDGTGEHGFLYNAGATSYTALNEPSGPLGTAVYSINNSGDLVGGYSPAYQHGFLAVPA